jgi:WD40 repeat protein
LPTAFALFVVWWISFSQNPRTTLIIPNSREDDFVSLEMSPNGRFLVSLNRVTIYIGNKPDEFVQFWNLERGELCRSLTIQANDYYWTMGIFSLDDRWFAVPTTANTVRLWNPQSGKSEAEYHLRAKNWPGYRSLAFTAAGKLLEFQWNTEDQTTTVYEVETGRELHRFAKGYVTPLVADQLLHSFEGQLRLFRLDEGLDLSTPYLQNPFQKVDRDANGELVRSFGMGHEFQGCTRDGTVLFGICRYGGSMSSTYNFYQD